MVRSEFRQTPVADTAAIAFMHTTNIQKAAHFHSLHDHKHPLALANAWDVASALVIEAAGAQAIATTSAGVAWSLGFADGDRLERARALSVISGIANAVNVPVTADIEGGYADSAADVARTVDGVLEAGAVGINIEDGSRSADELESRIAAARRAADQAGVPLFINARTDVFLTGIGAPELRVAETLARANQYVDAGADGIFVPGVVDSETIATLGAAIPVPLNVMVGAGAPTVAELGRLGVARVSLGSGVAQAAYAVAGRAAQELLADGTYRATSDALDFGELNGLLAGV
jgi:2-methylisocitrate lyase-like PEP mutase family enzyme